MTTIISITTENATATVSFTSEATCAEHLAMFLRLLGTVGFMDDSISGAVAEFAENGWADVWPSGEADR